MLCGGTLLRQMFGYFCSGTIVLDDVVPAKEDYIPDSAQN